MGAGMGERNPRAWLLVAPVLLVVGFNAIVPLLPVVNYPVQDIIRATHGDTLRHLEAIASVPIRSTARLFTPDPEQYYYAFDGHINAAGSRRIADLLIESAQPI